jgi:hypothetical protein
MADGWVQPSRATVPDTRRCDRCGVAYLRPLVVGWVATRRPRPPLADGIPARQRATEASLRQRLETPRAENQRLREENANLKTELAIAYGQQTPGIERLILAHAAIGGRGALQRS